MVKKISFWLMAGLVAVVFASSSWAVVPRYINFQGKVTGGDIPASGTITKDMLFKFYDALTGGTQIGSDIQVMGVTIKNGIFNTEIPITDPAITFDKSYWLDITVGTAHMTDLQSLATVPYAFRAAGIVGSASTDNKFLETGNVGIGTTSPQKNLSLTGSAIIHFQSSDLTYNSGSVGRIRGIETGSGIGDMVLETGNGGSGFNTNQLYLDNTGYVGIGIMAPGFKLDIATGPVRVYGNTNARWDYASYYTQDTGSSPRTFAFGARGGAFSISDETAGAQRMKIDSAGNVGIGTAPNGNLTVGGLAGGGNRMVVADSTGLLSAQAIPIAPVSSVFGRTGVVGAQAGDYTTSQVTEGTNLYFTDARAQTAIQTQLSAKANLASPTFTGTVGGITKSMVGLGNVDNTTDTAKPVSTAQQTALALKANLASPTFTGNVNMPGTGIWNSSGYVGIGTTAPGANLEVVGNGYVSGYGTSYPNLSYRRARGSLATPSVVSNGDMLGGEFFYGYTGSTYNLGSSVRSIVDGAPSTYIPSKLSFSVSDGTAIAEERMVIKSNGNVGIGTTTPGAKLEVKYDDDIYGQMGCYSYSGAPFYLTTKIGVFGQANSDNYGYLGFDASLLGKGGVYGKSASDFAGYFDGKGYFSGNVGIGTTTPFAKLEVADLAQNTAGLRVLNSTGDKNIFFVPQLGSGGYNLLSQSGDSGIFYNETSGLVIGPWLSSPARGIRINSAGNVGIGTANPDGKLHVSSSESAANGKGAAITIQNTHTDGRKWYLRAGASGTSTPAGGFSIADDTAYRLVIKSDGNVGIGTANPLTKLAVVGLIGGAYFGDGYLRYDSFSGDIWFYTSSRRYKDNIQLLSDDFDKILNVQPKSYTDKARGEKDIGYIAEEFDELGLKNLVIYDKEGRPDSIQYDKIPLYMLEVMKSQQSTIADLKAKNDDLEARVRALEERVGAGQ